jgi:hypothetical protein
MATNTYVALDKVTVATTTATVSLTSISGSYTDLVLVIAGRSTRSASIDDSRLIINSDSGSNYSNTHIYGDGSSAGSDRFSSSTYGNAGFWFPGATTTSGIYSATTVHFQNYSNSTTNKSWIVNDKNQSNLAGLPGASVGLWRSTSAITRLDISLGVGSWAVGSTFELYGILAEGISPTTKATGGAVYSDSTYYYHVFGASGTFTPTQSITADLLVIAGGGGSGYDWSGSGGAGGVQFLSGQSLTATGYSITVGAGGASATAQDVQGSNGGNSTFGSTIVNAIGGGGAHCFSAGNANSGGSGGGGGTKSGTSLGGAAVAGTGGIHYGNAGGNGTATVGTGGGGGAGGVGENNTGVGGPGTTLFSSWGLATGAGTNVSGTYYFAAGGQGIGGAAYAARGAANTGNGAGSDNLNGAGGSGIVIVRYAK